MAESTTPHIITRQCSCGKQGDAIDVCQICAEYRAKQLPQTDSFILSALKLHIVEALFNQQYYAMPGGNTMYYGGQAKQLVENLMKNPLFAQVLKEVEEFVVSKKEEWLQLGVETFKPYVKDRAAKLIQSYEVGDSLYALMRENALAYAKELFTNDEILKEKIRKAVKSEKYTVEFDIRIKIMEERSQ